MNQLIHLCQIYVGAKGVKAFCPATFREDLVSHIRKGLVKNESKRGPMEPSVYTLTEKGTYVCRKLLELADEGAVGNVESDEEDEVNLEPKFGWKKEAEKYKLLANDLYIVLNNILEIGTRNMSNPKYNGYFDSANRICNRARKELGHSDEV